MGAADGPRFAPDPKGTDPEKMIRQPPCGCPECVAGPGLAAQRQERLESVLGPITKVITRDYCMICSAIVTVTATRNGPSWINECENAHVWRSFT